MKKFRWQILIVLITALLVGVILFFQQSQVKPEAVSTPSPISGGTYTEALVGHLLRLNPILDHLIKPIVISTDCYSAVWFVSNRTACQLAIWQSWTISTDGTVFTFNLRLDAVWHDGVPVTAQDVAFTVSLMQSGSDLIPEDLRSFWSQISVNPISDSSLEFALPIAFSPFLDYLSFQILPSHLLGNLSMEELVDHPFNLAPIGSGPYKFDSLETEDGAILGVNLVSNGYYFEGRPFIDEIRFRYYPDESSALDAYQEGAVDGVGSVALVDLKRVLNQTG